MPLLTFLLNLAGFLVPAALASVASARIARISHDEWRLLAWVPVAPLALWGVSIAWGVTRDPTSHNLWPFELVAWSVLSLLLFAAVLLARRVSLRSRDDWVARRNRSADVSRSTERRNVD